MRDTRDREACIASHVAAARVDRDPCDDDERSIKRRTMLGAGCAASAHLNTCVIQHDALAFRACVGVTFIEWAFYRGRFSNGPVAFEYLWALLSRGGVESAIELTPSLALPSVPAQGGVSFAFGASGTSDVDVTPGGFLVPGLKGQVQMFRAGLGGNAAPSRALYAILSGANDSHFYWDAEHPTTAVHGLVGCHLFTTLLRGVGDQAAMGARSISPYKAYGCV